MDSLGYGLGLVFGIVAALAFLWWRKNQRDVTND
jgi:hypothetical protein